MREPARTKHAARQRYTRILQQSLSCLANARWFVGPSPRNDDNLALLVNPRSIRLRREGDRPDLYLLPSQLFTIVDDTRYPGEYKASTLAYIYSVQLADENVPGDREIMAWHWHPLTTPDRPSPHLHVRAERPEFDGTVSKLHFPSGRVSFEEVLRFLISDLRVKPAREKDWKKLVADSEARFKAFRTWA